MDLIQLGLEQLEAQEFEAALETLTRSLDTTPTAIAYVYRGDAFSNLQKYPEAIADFRQAIVLTQDQPMLQATTYRGLGLAQYKSSELSSKLEEPIKALQTATELNPNYAEAWSDLGLLHNDLGLFEIALKQLNRSIELEANSTIAYLNRGRALYGLG
jgi:tetratricopeptide (TPR) repeat protein